MNPAKQKNSLERLPEWSRVRKKEREFIPNPTANIYLMFTITSY